jgi:hypothetical protein
MMPGHSVEVLLEVLRKKLSALQDLWRNPSRPISLSGMADD